MKYNLKTDNEKLKQMFPTVSDSFDIEYLKSLKQGKTMINDSEYCIRTSYNMRPLAEQFFESHQQYIDIHITLSGSELFGYSSISELQVTSKYDQAADCILYDKSSPIEALKSSNQADVLVFDVDDGHMTAIGDVEDEVDKVIIKVLVENFIN